MDILRFPAAVFETPGSLAEVKKLAEIFIKWNIQTLFVSEGGLNAFIFIEYLKKYGFSGEFGLCMHARDKNGAALASDVLTAREVGVRRIYFREPDYSAVNPVNFESSLSLIKSIRKSTGDHFKIMVQNSFMHKNDEALLKKQLAAGADMVAVNRGASGSINKTEYLGILIDFALLSGIDEARLEGVRNKKIMIDMVCDKVDLELASKLFE